MISGVALSLLWIWLFNPQVGILNYFIVLLGGQAQPWLQSSTQALSSLLIMNCWTIRIVGKPQVKQRCKARG